MAYAAVLSLNQTLEQISNPYLEQQKTPLWDQQIKSLQEKLNSLLDFLDDSWQRKSEEIRCLEREIRDAAYKAEDLIDLHISMNFGQEGFLKRKMRNLTFLGNMIIVADEIDSIKTKAAKLKGLWGATYFHQRQKTSLPTGPSRLTSSRKNAMIGFQDDLNHIMDRLTRYPPALTIIPVIGMGGIGKTTLAKNAYGHPRISLHFDTRAWVSISQEYHEREVLLSLLDSMKQLSPEMSEENDTEKLKECLYKSLKGRRYLVVLDDVWDSEALGSLRRLLPDDGIGSRIMLTSRLLSVFESYSSPHHVKFLNKIDSWNLLRREVFGEDCCPSELEEAGKEISENCKGLPLSLVVMGGHLSKANRAKDHWEYVAKDVKSVVTAEDTDCSKILSLSYDYLPHYLKACFLYMGVFPEDAKIRVSKLIKLWVAEGFLKPVIGKTLEEVAEEYLGDLISRNLILISEKSSRGKIKSCSIHDLLRDLCIRKAQEEKFFHVADKAVSIFAEYSRRLCINTDNSNVNLSTESVLPVRSVLGSGYASTTINLSPLVRVLFHPQGTVDGLPLGEKKLFHLRLLSLSCREKIYKPKILADFFWNLQTLILDSEEVHLPEELWRMPHLRHLRFGVCYLSCPARSPIDGETLVLENLLTLSQVSSTSCTKELFERVPNLNKLGIFVELYKFTPFSLGNLPQLENLKIRSALAYDTVPLNFNFTPNIRKLTLELCKIPWKHMTIVGSMPNLEVLKLRNNAFEGPEWEPIEGEFCKLKYLLLYGMDLVQWRADNTHFTSLECLVLRRCFKLEEIPCSILMTIQIIDLDDASPSVVTSAKQIQEELGNDILHVSVLDVFHSSVSSRLLIKDRDAEIISKFLSSDNTLQLEGTTLFRKILSDDSISSVEEILSGAIPRLLEFLDRDDYPQLQCEAALTIKSISYHSSDIINMLIDRGAIPILVSLLSSPNDDLREKALETLGNFVLDSTKSRDQVLSYGVLTPLLTQLNDKTKLSIVRKATQVLANLCWENPEPEFEQLKPSLLPLVHLIHKDDARVLSHACMALLNLFVAKTGDMIQVAIDAGVFPRLVELLQYRSPCVWYPALRCVRNLISSLDDIQIQVITCNQVLLYLHNLLTQDYGNDAKCETIMIISEIIKRSEENIQALIEVGIISSIVQLLQHAEFDQQKMAAWAIVSAMVVGTNEQIKFLVHEGCIKLMCDLLFSPNPNPDGVITIRNCLSGLKYILKVGEAEKNTDDVNVFAQMIEDAGGLQKIKNLQTHNDSIVRQLARKTLQTYWLKEDDNNNEDSEDEDEDDEESKDEDSEDEDEDEDDNDNDNDNDNDIDNDEESKDEDSEDDNDNDNYEESEDEDEENDNDNFLCFLLKILRHLWCTLMDRGR